jgi:hypothetical protein
MHFWQSQTDNSAHGEVLKRIHLMGSADMDLQDGTGKQPDFSFIDRSVGLVNEEEWCFPTTIIEVAFTETSLKLAVDCGRFICCSIGRGLLAIAIDIRKDTKGKLLAVRFAKWELSSIEEIGSWPPEGISAYSGKNLDTLYRSDGVDEPTPATAFYCISRIGAGEKAAHYVFHAKEVEACLVGPFFSPGDYN